jgi:hypothetical protein
MNPAMQDRSCKIGIKSDNVVASASSRQGRTPRVSRAGAAKTALVAFGLMSALGVVGAGCLSRPVKPGDPTTKTNFATVVRSTSIDKVDLLFAIDNSASMGDKQKLLALAVPDLVNRLINPFCLDGNGKNLGASTNGDCTRQGGEKEFPPVQDLHIGIISSSLGGVGSNACPSTAANSNNDDRAHLLNRGSGGAQVPNAGTSNFLAWLPTVDANKGKPDPSGVVRITKEGQLATDFADLVTGVREFGCGFEAQLESVYRFLNQPDPYQKVGRNGQIATLEGVDTQLLQQRADFLRPDSLVAVIMITDENDSTIDPLSVAGKGWAFLDDNFLSNGRSTAPRATAACAKAPGSPDCSSCLSKPTDPSCSGSDIYYKPGEDTMNVRPIRMKERFGIDPQFPISRYVNGFRGKTVPNRNAEHPLTDKGAPSNYYVGTPNCTNPLFAKTLPKGVSGDGTADIDSTLCKLPVGPRSSDLVFFAVIGGVPWQLLATDPTAANVELKGELTDSDWTTIIGKDPVNYDTTGIDPHMIESFGPRPGLQPPTANNTADAFNGREWDTKNDDVQFACTFPLPDGSRDCTKPENKGACDCDGAKDPPLCDGKLSTTQIRGKAYPTIREFSVVRALGAQGIISSICPIRVKDNADNTDPLFGYRPAVKTIVDRLKDALKVQCLPQSLTVDDKGEVPCLVLETLANDGDESECNDPSKGHSIPEEQILKKVREAQGAEAGRDAGAEDLTKRPVCKLTQIPKNPGDSCKTAPGAGWCYVTNAGGSTPAGKCRQAVLFTDEATKAVGSSFSLQCIRSSEDTTAKGDAGP